MKVRNTILLVLLLFNRASTLAQVGDLDSVKMFVLSLTQDTNSVRLLSIKSYANLTFRPSVALAFAQEVLKMSENLDYEEGEIIGLADIGNALDVLGNFPEALKSLLDALKKSEEILRTHTTFFQF